MLQHATTSISEEASGGTHALDAHTLLSQRVLLVAMQTRKRHRLPPNKRPEGALIYFYAKVRSLEERGEDRPSRFELH
jgi:hypothetical protein